MNPDTSSPSATRDRALRTTRRLRSALVGGSVAASLGLAGLLAMGAAQADEPLATQPGSTGAGASADDGTASTRSSGGGLLPGSGTPHATTRGS